MIEEAELTELKAMLLTLREELSDASEASQQSRNVVTLDQQAVGRLSRIDALQNQAMALATESRRKSLSGRLDAALERMDAGTYGHCEECDEPIPVGRLRLDPTVSTCVTCASGG